MGPQYIYLLHQFFFSHFLLRRWLINNKDHGTLTWCSSDITGVVAVAVDAETAKVAILTALGDIIIADSLKRVPAKRLKEGSNGIPFISQHTRDCILSWGFDKLGQKCIRMIKPGGALYRIIVE